MILIGWVAESQKSGRGKETQICQKRPISFHFFFVLNLRVTYKFMNKLSRVLDFFWSFTSMSRFGSWDVHKTQIWVALKKFKNHCFRSNKININKSKLKLFFLNYTKQYIKVCNKKHSFVASSCNLLNWETVPWSKRHWFNFHDVCTSCTKVTFQWNDCNLNNFCSYRKRFEKWPLFRFLTKKKLKCFALN